MNRRLGPLGGNYAIEALVDNPCRNFREKSRSSFAVVQGLS